MYFLRSGHVFICKIWGLTNLTTELQKTFAFNQDLFLGARALFLWKMRLAKIHYWGRKNFFHIIRAYFKRSWRSQSACSFDFSPFPDTLLNQRLSSLSSSSSSSSSSMCQYVPVCASTHQYTTVRASTRQYAPVRASTSRYVPVRASTCQYVLKVPFHLHFFLTKSNCYGE